MLKIVRRPKSPCWVIRGSIGGIRVEESTGTSDRRTADEIRAKREAEIHRGQIYGREATATFAEAAVSYLESGGSRQFIEPVIKYWGTKPLDYSGIESVVAEGLSESGTLDAQQAVLHADHGGIKPRSVTRSLLSARGLATKVASRQDPMDHGGGGREPDP